MRYVRIITGILAAGGLVFAGLLLFLVSWWNADDWKYYIPLIDRHRLPVAAGGALYVVAAFLFCAARIRHGTSEYISFETPGGRVTMETRAVEAFIRRLAPDFPAVVRLDPKVTPLADGIDITVDVRIKACPQVKEICDLLQQKVRACVVTGLGITQVKYVEVNVRKIIGQTEPDLMSTSDDEELS